MQNKQKYALTYLHENCLNCLLYSYRTKFHNISSKFQNMHFICKYAKICLTNCYET